MTIENNKALVLRALKAISDRKLDDLLSLVHDEGSWSVPYREDMFPYSGFRNKAAFGEMIGGFLAGFTEFSLDVTSIIAEGDRVSAEAKSAGKGPADAVYKNVYHFSFLIRDGKIYTAREFFDPFEVLAYVSQIEP